MTIERQGDIVSIICDTCGEEYRGAPREEFSDVWALAKRDGWRVRKIANEWMHGCSKPNCVPA